MFCVFPLSKCDFSVLEYQNVLYFLTVPTFCLAVNFLSCVAFMQGPEITTRCLYWCFHKYCT